MANGGFKSSENLLGQTLLHLSASGSSIIAELLRLSQNIPDVLLEKESEKKFEPVLFGFEYLKNSEEHERRVNTTTGLLDLDQVFMDSYGAILVSLRHYLFYPGFSLLSNPSFVSVFLTS